MSSLPYKRFLAFSGFSTVKIQNPVISSKSLYYLLSSPFLRTNPYKNTTSSISPCPRSIFSSSPSPFFYVQFLTEHIKHFSLSSKYSYMYGSYQNTSSIFPCCPPSSFFYEPFLPEHIKYFPLSSKYFPLSSKYFPLSLKSIFLRMIPTRTGQVLALSSKYFSLSSKYFSYVQFLPEYIKCFFLSSKYLFLSSKRFGANNFKIIIEYILRQMARASLD